MSRSCTLIAVLACSIALLAFGPTPGSCNALRSPGVYGNVHKEIVKDAWDAVEKGEMQSKLLGQTKAKVGAVPMEVVHPEKMTAREVDMKPVETQLKKNLKLLEALAHYVNVVVSGSKYQPAPDGKEVEEDDIPQYKKLAKESENMLYKCNEVLKDIDHTRTFDNHNQFVSKWVGSPQQHFITPSEKNTAKLSVYKRSTSKTLNGNDPMIKLQYEAQMFRGEKIQLAYDMCVAGGHKVDLPKQRVESSNSAQRSALKALEETVKLFKVIKKHHDTIPDLMKDLKKEIKEETKELRERTKEWSKHVKVNNAEAHEQYLDRVEMDDDMEQLAKRKAFNLVKITQRLNRLHVERGRPCSGTRCETLRRVVGALRRAKKTLSDADVCDAAKDCQSCTKMSFCGWCDIEKTCLEGNVVRPRFGPSCGGKLGGWIHQESNAMCPSMDGKAPVAPVKYPDPSIFFDPECAHFNGSPGDCARAKLRLLAIEHMCLAKRWNKG